jgi:hypothetical protein
MNALQRFEGWVSQAVEGRVGGLLGAQVQPVDLAKRLADCMEDHRAVGAGRVFVPNVYRAYLAPATLSGFAAYLSALEAELAAFLTARAAERGFHTVGRIQVTVLADGSLRPERVRAEGDLVEGQQLAAGAGVQTTRPMPAAGPPPSGAMLCLVLGPRRVPLAGDGPLALGRALDNDVILDDTSVSRHHARFLPRVGYWLIEDLGSRHGTFVNNRRVTSAPVRAGDRIRLGATRLEIAPLAEVEAP